jgi:hypothetical protein
MLAVAIILFLFLVFWVNHSYECMSGSAWGGSGYKYVTSVDSAYRETHPKFGRITSVFKNTSPESWPFNDWNRAGAINVYGARKVAGIPHVEK